MDTIEGLIELASEYERELPLPEVNYSLPHGTELAAWIDHTLLKPEATPTQIRNLCQEALHHSFTAVCINPAYVPLAKGLLANSDVAVCTVVGFPLGATLPTYKVLEALACLEAGADEIDMVINIGALKGEAYGQVYNEILSLAQVCHNQGSLLKVILETALLTRWEKILACLICKGAGADFVKTSTGFGPGGATTEDVDLLRRVVGAKIGVKAAGGIRTLADANAMILAGANRIGTSSAVKMILESQMLTEHSR